MNLNDNTIAGAVLRALASSDPGAWCFLPGHSTGATCCSQEFLQQWKVTPSSDGLHENQDHVIAALERLGIDGRQFCQFVERTQDGNPQTILLVRADGLRFSASVVRVERDGVLLGHLVRFREAIDSNVIEAILKDIAVAQRKLEVLSPREREILRLVYEGRTNKAISIATGISEKTVEKHRARIMQKLKLTCTAELFRLMSRANLLSQHDQSGMSVPASPVPTPNISFSGSGGTLDRRRLPASGDIPFTDRHPDSGSTAF